MNDFEVDDSFWCFLEGISEDTFRTILGLFSAMSASSGGPNSRQIVEMYPKNLLATLLVYINV